jgi:hypothetical protein
MEPAKLKKALEDIAVVGLLFSLRESFSKDAVMKQPTEYVQLAWSGSEKEEPTYSVADGQHRLCLLIFLLRLQPEFRKRVPCLKGEIFDDFFDEGGVLKEGKTIDQFMRTLTLTVWLGSDAEPRPPNCFICEEANVVIARVQREALENALASSCYQPPPEESVGDKFIVLLVFIRGRKFEDKSSFGAYVPPFLRPDVSYEDEWLLILAHLFVFCKEARSLSGEEFMAWSRALSFRLGENLQAPLRGLRKKGTMIMDQVQSQSRNFGFAKFKSICTADNLSMCHGEAFAAYTHWSCSVSSKTIKGDNVTYPVSTPTGLRDEWKVILKIFSWILLVEPDPTNIREAAVLDVYHVFISGLVSKEYDHFRPKMFGSKKWVEFRRFMSSAKTPPDTYLDELVFLNRPSQLLMSYWEKQEEVPIYVPQGGSFPAAEKGEEDSRVEEYFSDQRPFFTGRSKKKKSKKRAESGGNSSGKGTGEGGGTTRQKEINERNQKKREEEATAAAAAAAAAAAVVPQNLAALESSRKKAKTGGDVVKLDVNAFNALGAAPAVGQQFFVEEEDLGTTLPILLKLAGTYAYTESVANVVDGKTRYIVSRPSESSE